MRGVERQEVYEENNEWGGKAGKYMKRKMSGVERQVWFEENNEWG
jgi:hypothetical protein